MAATAKELLPIPIALALWGDEWAGSTELVRCDNMAVVHILRSDSAKNAIVMHLLHCLFFILSLHLSDPPASTRDPQHSGRCTISGQSAQIPIPGPEHGSNANSNPPHPPILPPTTATTGLDRPPMADPVHFHLTKGLACSTQHAYSSGQRQLTFLLPI